MTGDPFIDAGVVLILVTLFVGWRGIFKGWNR